MQKIFTEGGFKQWFEKEYADAEGSLPDVEIDGIKYPIFNIDDLAEAFEAGTNTVKSNLGG